MMVRRLFPIAALSLALALGGCGLPIAHTDAGLDLPATWQAPATPAAVAVDADWWRGFGSPELAGLVETARAGSFDVAAAVARVRQADALARMAGAALLPEVDGTAGAERTKVVGYPALTSYTVGLSASYELDIWGGTRAARQAAVDTLAATAYAHDAVLLTLTAGVADTYLQTLALRERVAIARQNLATGERILAFVESQYRAGAATALDLAQQRGLVASLRQTVAQRDQQARDSLTALAVLIGRAPQGFDVGNTTLEALALPTVSACVPADLLVRRPDVAQAERQLATADADVTVARAAMLPSLTLTASAGVGNDRLAGLFDHPIYDLAAGIAAPIFNAGRLAAGRDLALAQREELLADYRKAIVAALGDVETALNAIDGVDRQQQAQDEALTQAQAAVRLAESRYRAGAETLLTLLDAQRTLYDAQDQAVQLRLARLQASVALYKALGGGWRLGADTARRTS
ncbi:transporter [Bordetella genomosp. 10]|uniref:Transporter n=1 Tax=Bordetella genomosp. 10 TaxID=1416804 RepID=A0A261S0E3_9BORD|nr:efflux transporter outer membrane subunit [Bordetella genomosp. 10]OZI30819.1 transporter [Bordetella genomosp. 10]